MNTKDIPEMLYDNFIEPDEKIEKDLIETKEMARVNAIVSKLILFDKNVEELTNTYTEILKDDNVVFLLTRISQTPIFKKHFPEFFVKNEYGEDVINCQQNSSYHKYGVFKHILVSIENVGAENSMDLQDSYITILKWTMFLHDIGKPYVKVKNEDGTDTFIGHDDKSYELAIDILNRFSFSREDKSIILTLIKYHDKYINEGEVTDENMKFLASELSNSKMIFDLLLAVKDADSRAKSIEVYNKFKILKNRYLEFIEKYFSYDFNEVKNDSKLNNKNETQTEIKDDSLDVKNQEMSTVEFDELIDNVISRKSLRSLYQPMVDIKNSCVYGYEEFTRIESVKRISIIDFFNRAIEKGKYEKIQQVLLINGIETFMTITTKDVNRLFINADFRSYQKYANKPRIYEMMNKTKIVIEFQNYEKVDILEFQETIKKIHENGGEVALDKYGTAKLRLEELNLLDVDYIVTDIVVSKNIENDRSRQKFIADLSTYALSRNIKVIVVGIESKEALDVVKKYGVDLVQGYYFAKPDYKITCINESVKQILQSSDNDSIV